MQNQYYLNGKPATFLQKLFGAIVGLGSLILFFMFGAIALVIGLGVAVVGGALLWWRTRSFRKAFREQMARAEAEARMQSDAMRNIYGDAYKPQNGSSNGEARSQKGELLEGEFKEL